VIKSLLNGFRREIGAPMTGLVFSPVTAGRMSYFLSEGQRHILQAACSRLVPADDQPDAAGIGVADYIDGLGPVVGLQEQYTEGLAALGEISRLSPGICRTCGSGRPVPS
jgi:hypothetical protein